MPASRKFFQRRKKRRSSSSLSKTSPTSASGLAACSETSLRTLAAKPSKLSSAEKDVPSPASRSKRPSQEACSNVRSSISFLQPDGRKLLACCQSSKRPVAAAVRRSSASLIIARRSASVCITVMLCRLLIVVVTSCGAPRFSQEFSLRTAGLSTPPFHFFRACMRMFPNSLPQSRHICPTQETIDFFERRIRRDRSEAFRET